jgi:hypothetical protein
VVAVEPRETVVDESPVGTTDSCSFKPLLLENRITVFRLAAEALCLAGERSQLIDEIRHRRRPDN